MSRRALLAGLVALCAGARTWADQAAITVAVPADLAVFSVGQFEIGFAGELAAFAALPDDQVNDAYDADRNGVFLRMRIDFTPPGGGPALRVPAFAMRDQPQGPWRWRVRFSPTRPGTWHATLRLDGAATSGATVHREVVVEQALNVADRPSAEGPLIAGSPWLRELRADGTSVPRLLFGACRAWVVDSDAAGDGWAPFEGIDREHDLFPVLRANGYNLLNQWMAPWEYQLVHRDRAEYWRNQAGSWQRHELRATDAWTPWACYDQGRAQAFDELMRQCEGGPGQSTIRLLLAPFPHRLVEMAGPGDPGPSSNWRAPAEGGGQAAMKLCGFSAFRPDMDAWDFFAADPLGQHDDWRARLFDAQANYFRYLVARWSASRAIGLWVLMDEIDAVGDQFGIMAHGNGWFAHQECSAWLANLASLMRGELKRADGLVYDGDPYHHPLHAATTSIGSEFLPGANLEWRWRAGEDADANALQVVGWHWYPRFHSGMTYDDAWRYTVDGIAAFSARSQLDHQARLIAEFGAPDRQTPEDEPSTLYPTLYHMGIWAAIFSGQAGTVMDWDDGKEFGEIHWRSQPGVFDHEHYPVDNAGQVKALRAIVDRLDMEHLRPLAAEGPLHSAGPVGGRALVLVDARTNALHGWVLAPHGGTIALTGLAAGTYDLTFDDPWLGTALPSAASRITVAADGSAVVALEAALEAMRPDQQFPRQGRLDRGKDVVVHLSPSAR